ncbi:helix-turn-helix transcriptional regulator [Streptomyces winkii]|uniref:helix-turn-helix transcriptional regulator n=1 Tax=Streptomyces winkii TaxID=3051178 RepID=UPI0028D36C05|nr:LuxR C-terminal-related transcriptional regulator [Streptomyces sp. DSM 40971]
MEFLGLGERALKVYQEMLRKPGAGVEEIADELGWDIDRVRSGLDELAEQQLVRPSWETSGVFQPVSPQVGLAALIARREADLTRFQNDLAASKVLAEQLGDDFARSVRAEDSGDVERLVGIDAVRSRIEQLSQDCRKEVLSCAPDGAQTQANRQAGRPLNQMLLERGVKFRTIYLDSVRNDRDSVEYAQWLTGLGAEIRTLATVPSRMLVFDREFVVAPMDPEVSGSGALVVKGSAIAVAMHHLFALLWKEALPLTVGARLPKSEDEINGQERAVLDLLADGHTDETVARRLGVSVRTARRVTADLMSRVNARSRFELAVQATRRGWVSARK